MSHDLDKAELMLEEYHDKNQEQEHLIIQLGEQYKEEKIAKEQLIARKNEKSIVTHLR